MLYIETLLVGIFFIKNNVLFLGSLSINFIIKKSGRTD